MYAIIILQIDGVVGRFCEVFPYFSSTKLFFFFPSIFSLIPKVSPLRKSPIFIGEIRESNFGILRDVVVRF